jgi:hypothetical protein
LERIGEVIFINKINISSRENESGVLDYLELEESFPFIPKRIFTIRPNSPKAVRGNHAHKKCQQFVLSVSGSCKIEIRGESEKTVLVLEPSKFGVYVQPLTWVSLFDFTNDACILVLASHKYDEEDYIHDFQLLLDEIKNDIRS